MSFAISRPIYYFAVVSLHYYMLKWHDHLYPNPYYQKVCWLTLMSFFMNFSYYSWMLVDSLNVFKKNFTKVENSYFKFIFCISFVVFSLFWTIMMIDRNMLINPEDETPTFLNIFTHGGNFVLNLFEHLFVKPRGDSTKISYLFFIGFMLIYSSGLKLVFSFSGFLAYPFVEKAPILHYAIVNLCGFLLVCLGDKAFRMLIRKEFYELNQSKLAKMVKAI